MVNDQEPRYRLVDADGNVVGSLFAESDGTLKLQEGTSGSDNELSLSPQGELSVSELSLSPRVDETKSFNANETRFFAVLKGVSPSAPVFPTVVPASGTGSSFVIEAAAINSSENEIRWKVSEVGGSPGHARFILLEIPP